MAQAKVTSKGQVTIPKKIRDSLKIHTGDKIEFIPAEEGKVILKPISQKVDDVFGILHKTKQKPISISQMEEIIKERMKKEFE